MRDAWHIVLGGEVGNTPADAQRALRAQQSLVVVTSGDAAEVVVKETPTTDVEHSAWP